jgi:hypothetical protein
MADEEKTQAKTQAPLPILLDALSHPFSRLMWWVMLVLCSAGFLIFLGVSMGATTDGRVVISGRLIFGALFLIGLVIRCYFTIIEHTLTDWGKEAWQHVTMNTDGLWSSIPSLLGLAGIAWLPAILVWQMVSHEQASLLGSQLAAAFGCEYFCLGILALVVFDNFAMVMPQHIMPAMFRCGLLFLIAGPALTLVPLSFQIVWTMQSADQSAFLRAIIASSGAAFFLIAHARLMGLLYLANRERIGWQD